MHSSDNRNRCKDILATEIVEDITNFLEEKGLLRSLNPNDDVDIETFQIMINHVKSALAKRVKEFENWRDS